MIRVLCPKCRTSYRPGVEVECPACAKKAERAAARKARKAKPKGKRK